MALYLNKEMEMVIGFCKFKKSICLFSILKDWVLKWPMVKFLQDYEYIQTFCHCSTRHESTLNQSHCLLSSIAHITLTPIFCYLSMSYVHGKTLTPGQLGHFMCLLHAYTPKAMSYTVEFFINIFHIIELCNRWGIHIQVIL